jgi:hypothetical protein
VADDQKDDQKKDWQVLYQAAILELDPVKLPDRIEQAHNAIQAYLTVVRQSSDSSEWQPLEDALHNLRVLRRELSGLGFNPST